MKHNSSFRTNEDIVDAKYHKCYQQDYIIEKKKKQLFFKYMNIKI